MRIYQIVLRNEPEQPHVKERYKVLRKFMKILTDIEDLTAWHCMGKHSTALHDPARHAAPHHTMARHTTARHGAGAGTARDPPHPLAPRPTASRPTAGPRLRVGRVPPWTPQGVGLSVPQGGGGAVWGRRRLWRPVKR